MYPRVSQSTKSEPQPMTQFILPMLTEAAKDMLADESVKVEALRLKDLEELMCRRVYGKLWKRNKTGLAIMLETTGWMRRFVRSSIMAVAKNLRERGDANAE